MDQKRRELPIPGLVMQDRTLGVATSEGYGIE